jgi:hypothetical protein
MLRPHPVLFGLFLVMVVLIGCSDPYAGRMEITGSVTLEKQPLNDGAITFIPLEEQGSQTGGPITNGSYTIPRKHGLKPGKYLVQITSGDGKTPATGEEEAGAPGGSTNIVSVDRIPPEYNTQSKQEVVVKSRGTNKFDFDIPKAVVIPKR